MRDSANEGKRLAFLFRTDVHLADKGPASWKGDYTAEILNNLRQIGSLATAYDVEAVLDGGDFFHVKSAIRNSHALMVQAIDCHRRYPCSVFSVEGNHDMTGNNLDTIKQQPLGVLYATGTFQHLRNEHFGKYGPTGEVVVQVVGVPYSPSRDLREIQAIRKDPGVDYLVAIVHALAAEDPPAHIEEFFGEPVFRYRDLIFEDGPDVFCFGHWHKDQGIVQLEGRHFVNQGAVSRGALTHENTERTPKVSLLEFTKEGITCTAIPLEVAPAAEVFDFERKDRQDQELTVINQFVEEFRATVQVDPSQDIRTSIRSMNFAPEVRAKALEYLEKVRT